MIRLRNVTKTYQTKRRKTEALKNINLTFASQGLYFVVGESGGGKTTLLNLISLQDEVSSGTIDIDGKDVTHLKAKEKAIFRNHYFGIVFQNINLIPEFSVFENMVMGLRLQKKEINEEEIKEVMKRLGLPEDILKEKIYHLSGGQRQRVAIARALLKDSKVMICDEPTGSLDEENAEGILKILKEISRERLVIVVSHDKVLSEKYGDQILQIEEGRIKKETIKTELVSSSEMEKTEMNRPPRLPFRFMVRMAAESFRRGMVRLIFTMISFVLGIAMLMVAISMYVFDITEATKSLIQSENITYFGLQKEGTDLNDRRFSDEEMEMIDRFFPLEVIPTYHSNEISFAYNHNDDDDRSRLKELSNRNLSLGISCISEEQRKQCGFSLFGRLPQTEDEIVLTKYGCYALGWVEEDQMDQEDVFQKILDERRFFIYTSAEPVAGNPVVFRITGIMDTLASADTPGFQRFPDLHMMLFLNRDTGFQRLLGWSDKIDDQTDGWGNVYILSGNQNYFKVDSLISDFTSMGIRISKMMKLDSVVENIIELREVYMKTVAVPVSLVFVVLSLLIFIGFIRFSVTFNQNKIRILKSLGITPGNLRNIFVIQSFLITTFCMIGSILVGVLLLFGANEYLNHSFQTAISYLAFSYKSAGILYLSLLLIASAITVVMNRIYSKKLEKTEDL